MKAQNGDTLTPYQKAGYDEKSLFYCNQLGIEGKVCCLVSEQGGVIHLAAANGTEVLTTLNNIHELPRDSEGYYIWEGGEQPVPDGWEVEVIFGEMRTGLAEYFQWDHCEVNDITAFRVLSTGVDSQETEDMIEKIYTPKFTAWKTSADRAEYIKKVADKALQDTLKKDLGSFVHTPDELNNNERDEVLNKLGQMSQDMGEYDVPHTAEAFLHQAAALMAEHGREYDKPTSERSTGKAVHAFNAITGRDLSEAEGRLLMSLVKRVRQYSTPKYSAEDAEALGHRVNK